MREFVIWSINLLCETYHSNDPKEYLDEAGITCTIIQLQRTTLWLSIASKHLANVSVSEFESPAQESPGEEVKPCATS